MKLWLAVLVSLFAICIAALPRSVRAEAQRSLIAIVRTDSNDPLLRDASMRLRAEIKSAGFSVVEVDRAPGGPRSEVERAEGNSRCFATVALHRASLGAFADVWISDRLTGKTVVRRIEVSGASNAAAVLAIRALELLRASLLEVSEPPRSTEPEVRPPPDVMQWMAPILPRRAIGDYDIFAGTALGVSALGLHGTDGLGLAVGPSLRISQGFGSRCFARLSLAGPLFGPEPTRVEGRATVRQEFAAVDFGLATDARPFGVFGWIGLGMYHLHAAGSVSGRYRATTDDVLSFLSNAGIGAMARVESRITLTAEFGILWLVPYPVVVIADNDVGSAGRPSFEMAVGVLVGL
ncbi:MAG: hypothetical protein JXA30_10730 [Deltaproteobacteria bacterium]|nr:hypothetical protein [Deltaproteobacteria bacterium]